MSGGKSVSWPQLNHISGSFDILLRFTALLRQTFLKMDEMTGFGLWVLHPGVADDTSVSCGLDSFQIVL
jgi:hypothetical protein